MLVRLDIAIINADIEALKSCIASGIEINQSTIHERKQILPLALAFEYFLKTLYNEKKEIEHFVSIIQLLIQTGAKTDVIMEKGNTLLHCLMSGYQPYFGRQSKGITFFNIIETEEEEVKSQQRYSTRNKALLTVAKILIDAGLSPKTSNNQQQTPFSLALEAGFEEMVLLFLDAGMDIHYSNEYKDNLLHYAVKNRLWQLFQKIIEITKLNEPNAAKLTPLDCTRQSKMVLALLQKGAVANRCDWIDFFIVAQADADEDLLQFLFKKGLPCFQRASGETALFHASSYEYFSKLIEAGANIHAIWNKSPPQLDMQGSSCKPLEEHKVNIFKHLFWQIREPETFRKIQLLVQKGFKHIPYETLFHQLIPGCIINKNFQWLPLFEYWLKQGAKINGKDEKGNTPLHIAVQFSSPALIDFLIENHAVTNTSNNEGERPLDVLNIDPRLLREPSLISSLQMLWMHYPSQEMPKNYLAMVHFIISQGDLSLLEQLYKRAQQLSVPLDPALLWQYTLESWQLNIAQWLITQSFSLQDIQIAKKYTLLQYAIIKSSIAIVNLLSEHLPYEALKNQADFLWFCWLQRSRDFSVNFDSEELSQEKEKVFQWLLKKDIPRNNVASTGKSLEQLLMDDIAYYPNHVLPFIIKLISCDKPLKLGKKTSQQLLLNLFQVGAFNVIQFCMAQGQIDVQAKLNINSENSPSLLLSLLQQASFGRASKHLKPLIFWMFKQEIELDVREPYLHWAVHLGWIEIAQIILEQSNVSFDSALIFSASGEYYGQMITPLEIATHRGDYNLVNLLLPSYAKKNLKAKELSTCLELAVSQKDMKLFELFFKYFTEHGLLEPNKLDKLFCLACKEQTFGITKLLLEAGCNVNAIVPTNWASHFRQNNIPVSAINYLISVNFKSTSLKEQFLLLLLDYKAKLDERLMFLLMIRSDISLIVLEKICQQINVIALLATKPLHIAVASRQLEWVRFFLEKYPQLLESRNDRGCTPLFYAMLPNNRLIFDFLRQQKADLQAVDYMGRSINWYALYWDTFSSYQLQPPEAIPLQEFQLLKIYFHHLPEADFINELTLSEYTAKLISLFKTRTAAIDYFKKFQPVESKQPLHDLCLFDLPMTGIWQPAEWAKLTLEHGPTVTRYLAVAPSIEAVLQRPPQSLAEIEEHAQYICYNREKENLVLARLCSHYQIPEAAFNRILDTYRPKETDYLPNVWIDGEAVGYPQYYLKKLSSNDWRGFVLGKITHCCQSIGSSGEMCAYHGMTSPYGGFYVLFKKNSPSKIANLKQVLQWAKSSLSYETFLQQISDKPQKKKYQEAQKILSKKISKMPQTLDAESVLIMQALVQMLEEELAQMLEGELIAQSWAWISLNGHLVFDSWERLRAEDDKLCAPFLLAAAKKMLEFKNSSIQKVLLGKGGQTPTDISFNIEETAEFPRDYIDYRDSHQQYTIATKQQLQHSYYANNQIYCNSPGSN